MALHSRMATLAMTGVTVAGLAQAGWMGLLAGADGGNGWLPLLIQGGLTLALAGAVGWQLRRAIRPVQASLDLLQQQAQALEQGRYVVAEDPPLPEALPLARSLNAAVRRAQFQAENRPLPAQEPLRLVRAGAAEAAESAESGAGPSRRALLEALRGARWQLGEFPVCDAEGRLLHLECPLRLQLLPEGRFEPAESWLAAAAHYRLMTQIDLAALDLALAACGADGVPRCVHVAAESLATAGFVSAVRARLEATPAAAACLAIEIAELSFERLPPQLRNAGTVWRRCGAKVGIEHAGTGLRGLLRGGELDFDYVKLAASHVQGLAGDSARREQVQGLIALVHELRGRVYAEGADEDGELQQLWALGFDGATGSAVRVSHAPVPASREGAEAEDQAMSPA